MSLTELVILVEEFEHWLRHLRTNLACTSQLRFHVDFKRQLSFELLDFNNDQFRTKEK